MKLSGLLIAPGVAASSTLAIPVNPNQPAFLDNVEGKSQEAHGFMNNNLTDPPSLAGCCYPPYQKEGN
jgi:hypothetical protein